LISAVQGSGGTLLNRLLEDHYGCHVRAHALKIEHPNDRDWPTLDLGLPAEWFSKTAVAPLNGAVRDRARQSCAAPQAAPYSAP
jgi:hypothetical protein